MVPPNRTIDQVFSYADDIFKLADEMISCTSTFGACSCGGTLDFSKKQWAIKKVFEIGKFVIFKKTREMYKCRKCKQFK